MTLAITKEEFREIYFDLPQILDKEELFFSKPTTDEEFLTKYLPSKLWRMNNLYTIVDKYGAMIIFKMRRAQHEVYAELLRHPRLIILKSRQQGISTFWLIDYFDDLTFCPETLSIGLMAQGIDEASSLLERTKILWEKLDIGIKKFLDIHLEADNAKTFKLSNGSQIFIRTSFRSNTLQRLHISEMGKIANNYPKKAIETKTGTLQAIAQGNPAVVESTAEGDNLFKHMWDAAVVADKSGERSLKDFKPVFLSWVDDPDCRISTPQTITKVAEKYFNELEVKSGLILEDEQKWFWISQYRELGDRIYQEYPATDVEAFIATKQGTYYAQLYLENVIMGQRRIKAKELYDKNLAIQVALDLGMDDTNVLCVFQEYQGQKRIIDEFADNGQKISYYTDWIKEQWWYENLEVVLLPHDAEVTDLTSGKTREEVFIEELKTDKNGQPAHKISVIVVAKTQNRNDDIEKVRTSVLKTWIASECEYLESCYLNYRKEWNEKLERFRDKPLHDEYSNGADSIRTMVIGSLGKTRFVRKIAGQTNKRSRSRGVEV